MHGISHFWLKMMKTYLLLICGFIWRNMTILDRNSIHHVSLDFMRQNSCKNHFIYVVMVISDRYLSYNGVQLEHIMTYMYVIEVRSSTN